jgi:hypothetical protein
MDWKKHVDTVIILGGILGSFMWMTGKFSDIKDQLGEIDKRLVRIETVLVMQGILPKEFAVVDSQKNPR